MSRVRFVNCDFNNKFDNYNNKVYDFNYICLYFFLCLILGIIYMASYIENFHKNYIKVSYGKEIYYVRKKDIGL
jgi:hypothetical protein